MWGVIVVFIMAALTGFYMLPAEKGRIVVEQQQARELAESMALYRRAVASYFSANDVTNASVGIDTLKASGVVPAWSTLYTRSAAVIWANYRDGAGNIYIYPATPAPRNIVGEVLALSGNSMTVGIYRASDQTLYAPADGTRVTLASLGAAAIPDGALVWLAARE
jgi:hypothetical protein